MYVGLIALLGAALFGAVIAPGVSAFSRRLVAGAWLVACAGTAAVIGRSCPTRAWASTPRSARCSVP